MPAPTRQTFNAPSGPAAAGPYSHAVRVSGELLFISGQIPLDPVSGEMVGDTAAQQARRCLQNLEAIAADAGASLANAVKVTVLLTDIATFAQVNDVYAEFFPSDQPARVAYAVTALPRGALVEIDAVVAVAG